MVDDPELRSEWRAIRQHNKLQLAAYIHERLGITIDPESMFDVLVKRLHEYKRQHLQILHILTLYKRMQRDPDANVVPRIFLFGGKAAPGYRMAKLIIKLIHSVGEAINSDPLVRGRLKVVFLPDYSVKLGQRVYPAADLSEQISLAGKEASGTGNMKFAHERRHHHRHPRWRQHRDSRRSRRGKLFPLRTHRRRGRADTKPKAITRASVMRPIPPSKRPSTPSTSGEFSHGDYSLFEPLVRSLLTTDDYMLLADYRSYIDCQERVSAAYSDQEQWTRMSIFNVARVGKFSSDRSIRDYCADIWKTWPVKIQV